MDDEILDLVDKNDIVIGTINRNEYDRLVHEKLGFIRASELFIINDEGKLWVPIRTATKTIAPNGYDYSAAGHVGAGDDYMQALIRETSEEINVDISPDDVEFVAKMKSIAVPYIRSIYLLRTNDAPDFNPHDFVSAEWLTPDELLQNIDNGHPAKVNFRETIVTLQAYLASF